MLFKQLFRSENYQKTLRLRLRLFTAVAALGVLLILLYFTVLDQSGLPDFVKGFYLGAGSGMALAGVYFAVSTARLLKNPSAARQKEISETDERERAIVAAAMQTVFWVIYVVLLAGVFLALPLSMTVFRTLLALLLLQSAAFWGAALWYRGRM